ncbi:knob-associated histidine-rich protein, putative [Plasmodium ovale wallikeri]|uniref:Knob-associated histidine-rich protein, putative n=2 Tax=Plasmodium ovale TaxID=36330 RepID=A0A1A8YH51_PLAOA|nr:knob-associated histidine-rich protein, putative [Plasmodium ovale wallikeri]SBT31507.1 knob-associated histidine-rich protein, putative [Plasmodium ovale wallikeri]SBT75388.1 knob-associated histidine-rich protein, putative [Plasmodium ovale]
MGMKINISLFFMKTLSCSLLFWILNCSNYYVHDKNCTNDSGKKAHSRIHRSLAVARSGRKNPLLKSRLVTEITHGGFKEYEEKYESKHYKLKENVNDGNKECDEKYEAANYGFREKCPYEVDQSAGPAGPDIFALRKRFPFGSNEEGEEEEGGGDSLKNKLPGSLDNYSKMTKKNDGYPAVLREYVEEDETRRLGHPARRYPGKYRELDGYDQYSPRGKRPARLRHGENYDQRKYPPGSKYNPPIDDDDESDAYVPRSRRPPRPRPNAGKNKPKENTTNGGLSNEANVNEENSTQAGNTQATNAAKAGTSAASGTKSAAAKTSLTKNATTATNATKNATNANSAVKKGTTTDKK